ncbi:LPS export ABC transporter periplasmic protein LptC [Aristophania vespae]|uniref:LPS export ABC transporter periplasmic protein LptC n=1 Tax=Aristophania vespae TaxID=2697033 RepID=UPI001F01763D|nr:LPS export ABC transporter periplasmic protein LptC [Aristophania vespae]
MSEIKPPPPPQRDDFAKKSSEELSKLNKLRDEAFQRVRRHPNAEEMARRQANLKLARWALPSIAAFILISLAAWPEITHLIHQNSEVMKNMKRFRQQKGTIEQAIYRDIDAKSRPYMLTSENAQQIGEDRINLTKPKADILMNNNVWLFIRADKGVYMRQEQTLNLTGHVVLYRNDGIIINGPSADLDLKQNVIATSDWVHAEGPFGVQDAQGLFLTKMLVQSNLLVQD